MEDRTHDTPVNFTDTRLLSYLYLIECFFAVFLLCLYKKGHTPLIRLLQRPAGLLFLFALFGIIFMGALIFREYLRHHLSDPKVFRFAVMMNLSTLAAVLVGGEIVIRGFSKSTEQGITARGRILVPQFDWKRVALKNKDLIRRASPNGEWTEAYLVPDALLGWTVGPSRRSADGLFMSSEEGLRSPSKGVNFRRQDSKRRIAVVGDSYTFGLEVSYEQAWAHQLELLLGDKFQVLNFGVDGYGVDQAYLRYLRDVKPWQPGIVIFSFTEHDLTRTLSVYPFITFPHWQFPFEKPRLEVKDGRLVPLNLPLRTPEEVFSRERVTDLPFLEYEPGYTPTDWEERYYHASYLVRYLVTLFPRWSEPRNEISASEYKSINVAILQEFASDARDSGMLPIIVYLPSGGHGGLPTDSKPWVSRNSQAKAVLEIAGVEYSDFTPCLDSKEHSIIFLKNHYTHFANQMIAECMAKLIKDKIQLGYH